LSIEPVSHPAHRPGQLVAIAADLDNVHAGLFPKRACIPCVSTDGRWDGAATI
jgi:hypothetical protein